MSNAKKFNSLTMIEVENKKLVMMRFKHNYVNFDITYEGHQNWLKT